MAGNGTQLAVAWFTAAESLGEMIRLAISTDSGASFAEPITVDEDNVLGRVCVGMLDDRSLVAAWLAKRGRRCELRARRIDANGNCGPIHVIDELPLGRATGFPRIATTGGRAVLVWTGFTEGEPHVRAVTILPR